MNTLEHLFCSSSLWRYFSGKQVLPWVLSGVPLGAHLLEVGAGYGSATAYLQSRVTRVTSLEYDLNSIRKLKARNNGRCLAPVCGDASQLPFAGQTFSSAVAILMLHHLKSPRAQDQMFAEVFRTLRPGGVFLALDIAQNWMHHVIHIRSTNTPIAPSSMFMRLNAAGFCKVTLDVRTGFFRVAATRPNESVQE